MIGFLANVSTSLQWKLVARLEACCQVVGNAWMPVVQRGRIRSELLLIMPIMPGQTRGTFSERASLQLRMMDVHMMRPHYSRLHDTHAEVINHHNTNFTPDTPMSPDMFLHIHSFWCTELCP